ncbi:MAG: thiamine-phosphate pyrophosphorylase [Candidatus Omnitrophica bacterium]|nr:thiamine-phosphate pyrophosphorylase [Candidatus Omnitrophota bacterium]
MRNIVQKQLCRIFDANINRAKEGLRVCEDICRFIEDNEKLTQAYKKARHQLTTIVSQLPKNLVLESRSVEKDIGRKTSLTERKRKNVDDIFDANSQRVKESIRVLEEFAKLVSPRISDSLKKLRYEIYQLEQKRLLH